MSDVSEPFDQPRMAINCVYTKRGDTGETSLAGGQRVPKDSTRIEAYGTIDELNAFVGLARRSLEKVLPHHPVMAPLDSILFRVQHELFNAGRSWQPCRKTFIRNRRGSRRPKRPCWNARSTP